MTYVLAYECRGYLGSTGLALEAGLGVFLCWNAFKQLRGSQVGQVGTLASDGLLKIALQVPIQLDLLLDGLELGLELSKQWLSLGFKFREAGIPGPGQL